jgi:hypothetical protein
MERVNPVDWFWSRGLESALRHQQQFAELGYGQNYRIIGKGGRELLPDLNGIYKITALGLRMEPPVANLTALSTVEREENIPIVIIVDIDGVLAPSPFSAGWKRSKIPPENLEWLRQATALADTTIICSARFPIPANMEGVFPFLPKNLRQEFNRIGDESGKPMYIIRKSITSPTRDLWKSLTELWQSSGVGMPLLYYIGSSDFDRRAASGVLHRLLQQGQEGKAERFIFIDTAHLVI